MSREVVEESKQASKKQIAHYEKWLQKSEEEVRKHISLAQQLKVYIHDQNNKIEECEKNHKLHFDIFQESNKYLLQQIDLIKQNIDENDGVQKIKQQLQSVQQVLDEINERHEQQIDQKQKERRNSQVFLKLTKKEQQQIAKKEKYIHNLEQECKILRSMNDKRQAEHEKLKEQYLKQSEQIKRLQILTKNMDINEQNLIQKQLSFRRMAKIQSNNMNEEKKSNHSYSLEVQKAEYTDRANSNLIEKEGCSSNKAEVINIEPFPKEIKIPLQVSPQRIVNYSTVVRQQVTQKYIQNQNMRAKSVQRQVKNPLHASTYTHLIRMKPQTTVKVEVQNKEAKKE